MNITGYWYVNTLLSVSVILLHFPRTSANTHACLLCVPANTYRIQFGQEKSKLLIIGKDNTNPTIKLGDMTIDPSETYKYLGETLNTQQKHKRPHQRNRKENRSSPTISPVHSRRRQLPRHTDGNHLDPNRIMHNTNHNIWIWNMGHKPKPNQETPPNTR